SGILAYRIDLGAVADDGGVGEQIVPEIIGLKAQPRRLEAEKRLFEAGPFLLDDAPGKAGAEHTLGHLRKRAGVGKLLQRLHVRLRGQQLLQAGRPALALLGTGQNCLERNRLGQTGLGHRTYSRVASKPAISRPRSARLSTMMCSLSVCGSAPRTPRPSSVGTPIAPVKFASDPPPALACGSSMPSCLAMPLAFS